MSHKTGKIIYWITTILLALSILPGVYYLNSEVAMEGMRHLSAPQWLGDLVGYGQPLGILLILFLPKSWKRLKERAYVGLGIVYISAFYAHLSVDGVIAMSFLPLVTLALLVTSYVFWHQTR